MGRVSLPCVSRSQGDLFAIKVRATAGALFSRCCGQRREVVGATFRSRRRTGHSDRRRTFIRRIAIAPASRHESCSEAGRSAPGRLYRLRSARREWEIVFETEFARKATASGEICVLKSALGKKHPTFTGDK